MVLFQSSWIINKPKKKLWILAVSSCLRQRLTHFQHLQHFLLFRKWLHFNYTTLYTCRQFIFLQNFLFVSSRNFFQIREIKNGETLVRSMIMMTGGFNDGKPDIGKTVEEQCVNFVFRNGIGRKSILFPLKNFFFTFCCFIEFKDS